MEQEGRLFSKEEIIRINSLLDQMKDAQSKGQLWYFIRNSQIITSARGETELASDELIGVINLLLDNQINPPDDMLFDIAVKIADSIQGGHNRKQ